MIVISVVLTFGPKSTVAYKLMGMIKNGCFTGTVKITGLSITSPELIAQEPYPGGSPRLMILERAVIE